MHALVLNVDDVELIILSWLNPTVSFKKMRMPPNCFTDLESPPFQWPDPCSECPKKRNFFSVQDWNLQTRWALCALSIWAKFGLWNEFPFHPCYFNVPGSSYLCVLLLCFALGFWAHPLCSCLSVLLPSIFLLLQPGLATVHFSPWSTYLGARMGASL